jgi:uncharacterized membrane protein
MTADARFLRARAATLLAWCALLVTLAAWQLAGGAGGGAILVLAATALPALAPLPGLWRGRRRSYRWAPLTLAPALAWSLTEIVANPPARAVATVTALLVIVALAAVVAALRTMPPAR